jgi:hypothetical protein
MKFLGIGLLALGVILAASAGIRLGKADYAATVADGRAALTEVTRSTETAPVPAGTRLADWFAAAGAPFLGGLVLLAIGAVVGRVAIGRDGAAATSTDGRDYAALLGSLAEAIEVTRAGMTDQPMNETRAAIERALTDLVLPMIDARGALQRRFGLGGAAQVLGPLSGAERFLNRAWSALVDQHAGEGEASLVAAAEQAALARQALGELQGDREE